MGRRHGGKRKGSGRKSNMAKAAQDARRHGIRSARDFFLEAPPEVPPPPEDNILEESKREEEEETNRLRLEEERRKVEEAEAGTFEGLRLLAQEAEHSLLEGAGVDHFDYHDFENEEDEDDSDYELSDDEDEPEEIEKPAASKRSQKNRAYMGIGPLWLDESYVEKGEPDPVLKGDLRFVAERMKVKCPPLPVAHQEERKMFNAFLRDRPSPKDADWRELAKKFLEKTDAKRIFPKLPSMLKSHFNKWKENQLIAEIEDSVKEDFDKLLEKLTAGSFDAVVDVQELAGASARSELDRELASVNRDQAQHLEGQAQTQAPVLPVPPVAAPGQVQFVAPHVLGETRFKECANAPACKMNAYQCGGFMRKTCANVVNGIILPPSEEEKQRHYLEKKRLQAERKRKAKKRKK